MADNPGNSKKRRNLPDCNETDHFAVRFNLRNARSRAGSGTSGVHDRALISWYLYGLEQLYGTLTRPPYSRRPPVTVNGKIEVLVFDLADPPFSGSPATVCEPDGICWLGLPCRTEESTINAEQQLAALIAVHEATHLFNHQERPLNEPASAAWEWLDEGTAVYMETVVLGGSYGSLRFFADWSDRPEVPLDKPGAEYQAAAFVRYLVATHGSECLSQIWANDNVAYKDESALDAIARVLRRHPACKAEFSSPDPSVQDVYFAQYCWDSFFLWDHRSPAFWPDIYGRFGERAIHESIILSADAGSSAGQDRQDSLDHLSCRYYRFHPDPSVRELCVEVETPGRPPGQSYIKAQLTPVATDSGRLPGIMLTQRQMAGTDSSVRLTSGRIPADPGSIDYFILTVCNCGYRSRLNRVPQTHIDGVRFTIRWQANGT